MSVDYNWLAMSPEQMKNVLEDADQLELLKVVAQKYKEIGESGTDEYALFHKSMARVLYSLVELCTFFYLGR